MIDGELEDASRAGLHLAIDQHLALHYPAAFYFFVSRQRPELAEAIRQGLRRRLPTVASNGCSSDISRRGWKSLPFGSGE